MEGAQPEGGDVPKAQCHICSRSFNADRLDKHIAICEKREAKDKKRKVFGASAERLKLQEKNAAEAAKLAEAKAAKKALWQQQHEQFQHAMKAAAAVKTGEAPPEPLAEPEDTRTPCPHCGRKFEAQVAERHIPKCAMAKAKPNAVGTAMKRPGSSNAGKAPPPRHASKAASGEAATAAPMTPPKAKDAGAAEPKLNPRQLIEQKKAEKLAAESPSKLKPAKKAPRKASPAAVR